MSTAVPRRLAIWDPTALADPGGTSLLRALATPEWPFDSVQFRLGDGGPERPRVRALAAAVHAAGRSVWVNRDRELARAVNATGLHVGAGEADEDVVAAAAADGLALGISIHGPDEGRRLAPLAPNYFLFGHVYDTPSKPGTPGRGLGTLAEVVAAVAGIPVLAIGGVNEARGPTVRNAGAAGWAAIRAAFQPDSAAV